MADGLVGRLALVAHKGVVLDADRREAKGFRGAAVGTLRVAREPGELPHPLLGGGQRHGVLLLPAVVPDRYDCHASENS